MKAFIIGVSLVFLLGSCNVVMGGELNPGLKAVADSSTDIVVAEVLDTKPTKAREGARDTARFKVIHTLKGQLSPGDAIGVYYHLLWIDTDKWILEKPKFELGKRYTIFLVKSDGYTLTDQWLAVLPEHPVLNKDVAQALNDVGNLWSDYWRVQNKGPITSQLRIELVPDAKMFRTKEAVTLGVKITNHSQKDITTRLAHEWHGGEWPDTDLFASATHVQAKQPKTLEPAYLRGENQGIARLTTIAPGKSVTVHLRMDWPGTGSVRAAPLVPPLLSECNIRLLLVFDAGGNVRETAASAVTYVTDSCAARLTFSVIQ